MKIIEYSFVIWRTNSDVEMNMANETETTAPNKKRAPHTHAHTELTMIRFAGNAQTGTRSGRRSPSSEHMRVYGGACVPAFLIEIQLKHRARRSNRVVARRALLFIAFEVHFLANNM